MTASTYCIHCGNELPKHAKFCSKCGGSLQSKDNSQAEDGSEPTDFDSRAVPRTFKIDVSRAKSSKSEEEISNFLKKFETISEIECLECLYSGSVGVAKNSEVRTKRVIFVSLALIVFFFLPSFWAALVAGAIAGILMNFVFPYPLQCPNCESLLKRQSVI